MGEEYTWHQVRGQFSQFMGTFKGLSVMLEMLRQAEQVEAYLAQHEDKVAELDAAMDVARRALTEVSEAYTELQDVMAMDKAEHAEAKRKMDRDAAEHARACEARVAGYDQATEQHLARMDEETKGHQEACELECELATAALELIYEKLEEADKKLAALRESL